MKKIIIYFGFSLCLLVLMPVPTQAQTPYTDFVGLAVRKMEHNMMQKMHKGSKYRLKSYRTIGATALVLKARRRSKKVGRRKYVKFKKIKKSCSKYFDPYKRKACERTIDYLKEASKVADNIVRFKTKDRIPNLTKVKIKKEYVDVNNIIIKHLSDLQMDADHKGFLRR